MENLALIIYSLKGGGAERVASTLSKELAKRYNLFLVLFDSDDIAYEFGGKLIDLNLRSRPSFFGKLVNLLLRTVKLRNVKKELMIDCSISLMESSNLPNVMSRVPAEKVIISFHSSDVSRRFLDPSSKADWIVGVSEGVSNKLITELKMPQEKVRTIYNPIDLTHLEQSAALEGNIIKNEGKSFVVSTMGRLSHPKGQWHLIRAFSRVKENIPDSKLLLLGEGELREYLTNLVVGLNLEDTVFLLGHQLNPFKELKNVDMFVFPSLYEGFPMVLCEAMSCGLPIIASDCKSGPREILAPNGGKVDKDLIAIEYAEYGVLVPVCDGTYYDASQPLTQEEVILADGIIELYNNESLRKEYSVSGKTRAAHFDIGNIIGEWETLIDDRPAK